LNLFRCADKSLAPKQQEEAKNRLNCWVSTADCVTGYHISFYVYKIRSKKISGGETVEDSRRRDVSYGDRASTEGERDISGRVREEERGKGRGGKGSDECVSKEGEETARARRETPRKPRRAQPCGSRCGRPERVQSEAARKSARAPSTRPLTQDHRCPTAFDTT
jgi:hypothetical protein